MKINPISCAGIAAIFGILFLTGCDNAPKAAEVGEKTGAALDKAAEKTVELTGKAAEKTGAALDKAAEKTVELTGKALDATGDGLKKAGAALENAGEKMQK